MTKTAVVQAQQRWEYVYIQRRSELALQDELNEMGQQGWELVTVEGYKDPQGVLTWMAFLKRPSAGPKPPGGAASEQEASRDKEKDVGTAGVQRPATASDEIFEIKNE